VIVALQMCDFTVTQLVSSISVSCRILQYADAGR
jgi:hypothetical protein